MQVSDSDSPAVAASFYSLRVKFEFAKIGSDNIMSNENIMSNYE